MCDLRTGRNAALLVVVGVMLTSTAHADPVWEDRFRAEGLPAWDAALAEEDALQGRGRFTRIVATTASEFEYEFKSNAECAMFIEKRGKDGLSEVYAYNPRYTFRLRSTADRGWALVNVHHGDPSKADAARTMRGFLAHHSRLRGYGTRIPHTLEPLAQYARAPTTRIVAVTPSNWKGVDVAEVKFELSPASKDDEIRSITSLHDPSRQWRIVRSVVKGQRDNAGKVVVFEETTDYEYAPGPDNLLSRAYEQELWTTDGKTTPVKGDRVFEIKRLKTLPETNEFTLTAFGLPEPVGVEWPARRSGWLWFAWAAAGCVVIAVVFLILRHRAAGRQTAAPATPS